MSLISAKTLLRTWTCLVPVTFQSFYLFLPILCSALVLRVCAKAKLKEWLINVVAIALGAAVLWFYYEDSTVYFFLLSGIVYALLLVIPVGSKGVVVGGACVLFIVIW